MISSLRLYWLKMFYDLETVLIMFQAMFLILRFRLKIFYKVSSPDTEWRNPWRVLASCEFYYCYWSSLSWKPSAAKHTTGAKHGKTCNRCYVRETCNRCRARKNLQPAPSAGDITLNRCQARENIPLVPGAGKLAYIKTWLITTWHQVSFIWFELLLEFFWTNYSYNSKRKMPRFVIKDSHCFVLCQQLRGNDKVLAGHAKWQTKV